MIKKKDVDITRGYDKKKIDDPPHILMELKKYIPQPRALPETIMNVRKFIRMGYTVKEARRAARQTYMRNYHNKRMMEKNNGTS